MGQQAAHGHEGNGVLRVLEERQIQPGLANQAVRILAELPQQPGQGEQGGHAAASFTHQRQAGR
jgi:hypothetical protein